MCVCADDAILAGFPVLRTDRARPTWYVRIYIYTRFLSTTPPAWRRRGVRLTRHPVGTRGPDARLKGLRVSDGYLSGPVGVALTYFFFDFPFFSIRHATTLHPFDETVFTYTHIRVIPAARTGIYYVYTFSTDRFSSPRVYA